jgi:FkbM family methyltransferase
MALQTLNIRFEDGRERGFRHRGTRADLGVIEQIFQQQDYSLKPLQRGAELQALYERIAGAGQAPLILDAGANIGASVLYFAQAFPRARIAALEPARNNFEVLQANIAGLEVDARCAAIGAADGETTLVDPGEGEWGYRTAAGGSGEKVSVISASRLVAEKRAAGQVPYIAKIDIEGGEAELFSRDTGWMDLFPLLIVELHDWLLPRAGSARNFLRCVAERDRDFVFLGENVFSIANHWTDGPFHV